MKTRLSVTAKEESMLTTVQKTPFWSKMMRNVPNGRICSTGPVAAHNDKVHEIHYK